MKPSPEEMLMLLRNLLEFWWSAASAHLAFD